MAEMSTEGSPDKSPHLRGDSPGVMGDTIDECVDVVSPQTRTRSVLNDMRLICNLYLDGPEITFLDSSMILVFCSLSVCMGRGQSHISLHDGAQAELYGMLEGVSNVVPHFSFRLLSTHQQQMSPLYAIVIYCHHQCVLMHIPSST